MSALLDDIISLAIDGKQPLPDILRKCLFLGHELKNDRLKIWANQELNGYRSEKDVPEYRIIIAEAKGNFVGPYYAQHRDRLIPSIMLEEKHREFAETARLTRAVSAYVDILKERDAGPSGSCLTLPWDPNLIAYYQRKLAGGGFVCHSAWQEISASAIAEMLDTVRNRTVNIALQIKDELGTSYTSLRYFDAVGEVATKIQNIVFQNTGGNTTVAFGQANVDASQHQIGIAVGDRQSLDRVLSTAGMETRDLDTLTEAIESDGDEPRKKVHEWIKTNAGKVLSGGVKVGAHIGQEILTAWIKAHYGI